MRVLTRLSCATVLSLAACGTSPDINPIYQAKTTYKVSSPSAQNQPVTQQANNTRRNQECLSKETDRKIIGTIAGGAAGAIAGRKLAGENKALGTVAGVAIGGAAGYGIADKTINCDPVTVQPHSTQTNDTAPGSQPVNLTPAGAVVVAPEIETAFEKNAASVDDDGIPGYYEKHEPLYEGVESRAAPLRQLADTTQASTPAPVQATPAPVLTAANRNMRYPVKPGDTVYSLARNACISVAEFKQINNIDEQYYIRAGDELLIPESRCVE